MRLRTLLLLATAVILLPPLTHGVSPVDLNVLLQERAGISSQDLQRLGDGFIARKLDVADPAAGLVLIGIMRVDTDLDDLHEALGRAGEVLAADPDVSIKALNVIAEPVQDDAFAAYQLTQVEKEALESCELGDCRVKLNEELIGAVRELDYRWEEDADTFTRMYRRELTKLARGYNEVGNRALWVYRDKMQPFSAEDGFKEALNEFETTLRLFPELVAHLVDYPSTKLEGDAEELLFWSVLDFGQRPTLTVNHLASIRPAHPEFDHVMVIKNLYANHYFGGRVTVGAFLPDGALDAPGMHLVLVDQLLYDARLNFLLRRMVNGGIVDDMENRLRFFRELIAAEQADR